MAPSKAVKESALDFGFLRLVYSHARQARLERGTNSSADTGTGRLEQVIRDVAEGVRKALRAKRFLKGGAYDRGPRGSRKGSSRVKQKRSGGASVGKKKGNRSPHEGRHHGVRHRRRGRVGSSEACGSGDESSMGSDEDKKRFRRKGERKGARSSSKLDTKSKAGGGRTASAVVEGHQGNGRGSRALGAGRLVTDEANRAYFRRTLDDPGHLKSIVPDGHDDRVAGRLNLHSVDGVSRNEKGVTEHSSMRSSTRKRGRLVARPNARLLCFTLLEEGCLKVRIDSSVSHLVALDNLLRRVEPRVHDFRGLSVVFGHSLESLLATCEERLSWGRDVDVIRDIQLYWLGDAKRYEGLKRRAMIEDRYDLLEQEVEYYRDKSSIVKELEKLDKKRDIARQRGILCPRTSRRRDTMSTKHGQSTASCDLASEASYSRCDAEEGPINHLVRPPWTRPPLCRRSATKQSPRDPLVGYGLLGAPIYDKANGAADVISAVNETRKHSCGLSSLWGNVYRTQNNRTGFCHNLS
ncbi:hypothetical protein FOL47_006887 [Perkinsus chesapeaki]|uniref:Uncharacterized protein n=1 Tax=Perkinsus chesapeaki TaxID=330153 RepID=A0A7J6LPZ5_PERCH|nr:hypothetical protein FOL47_006887 [Perkinsus chesapeaki]